VTDDSIIRSAMNKSRFFKKYLWIVVCMQCLQSINLDREHITYNVPDCFINILYFAAETLIFSQTYQFKLFEMVNENPNT